MKLYLQISLNHVLIMIFLFDISKTYKQTTNENSIQFR